MVCYQQEDGFYYLPAAWVEIMETETSCQFWSRSCCAVWSSLYKTLSSGQWSLQVMPVNRTLTCWCGSVQREYDRSATGNTATGGTVALEAAWRVCRVTDECWQRWRRVLAVIKKIARKRLNYCFFQPHCWLWFDVQGGIHKHHLNASLLLRFWLEKIQSIRKWSQQKLRLALGWRGSQRDNN